jgi:hypothetical protein
MEALEAQQELLLLTALLAVVVVLLLLGLCFVLATAVLVLGALLEWPLLALVVVVLMGLIKQTQHMPLTVAQE